MSLKKTSRSAADVDESLSNSARQLKRRRGANVRGRPCGVRAGAGPRANAHNPTLCAPTLAFAARRHLP